MLEYDSAWSALNLLIRSGKPFSGHERNCCFLNLGQPGAGDTRFANISAASGLDFDDDGRGLAYADWDGDGDLDLWITNRNGPRVRFVRNDTPPGDHARWVAFNLRGTKANRDAIGARVELHLEGEPVPRIRTLAAGHGHLSQSSKTIHFGLGRAEDAIGRIVVRWPGTAAEEFPAVADGERYLLVEGSGAAEPLPLPTAPATRAAGPDSLELPSESDAGRIIVLRPGLLPELHATGLDGQPLDLNGGRNAPVLLNLWATWCAPCVTEMNEWAAARPAIARSGLQIVSISVDDPAEKIESFVERHRYPFEVGLPGDDLLSMLDTVQRSYIGRQTDLPIPSSFLIDARGRVAAIYRGPVSSDQLLADLALLGAPAREVVAAAIPFQGFWIDGPQPTNPDAIASKFTQNGQLAEAAAYVDYALARARSEPALLLDSDRLSLHRIRGAVLYDLKKFEASLASWQAITALDPENRAAWLEVARCHASLDQDAEAASALESVLALHRSDPENLIHLAELYTSLDHPSDAVPLFEEALAIVPSPVGFFKLASAQSAAGAPPAAAIASLEMALELQPDWPPAANNLAWILATSPDAASRDPERAVQLAEAACQASNFEVAGAVATLAAAYASAGRFEEAAETNRHAMALAESAGDSARVAQLQDRQELFADGRPYRDAPPPP
ncbi:hypothetical protein BH23VER1_BH23VER1_25230 [soil metagenome]